MTRHIWLLANGILLLIFVFSAVVQFNDPDPVRWVALYGFAAAVCGLEIRRRLPLWAPAGVAIIALAWAGSLYTRAHDVAIGSLFAAWEMRDLHIEEAREMYGLAIVAAWMIAIVCVRWARARFTASAKRASGSS